MTVIGIDPGINGAVAVIADDNGSQQVIVYDLPKNSVRIGGTNRRVVDPVALIALLVSIGHARAFVEKVGPRPTDGPAGAYGFGYTTGIIHAALASVRYPMTEVAPITWRRSMGLPPGAGKDDSRALASRIFPLNAQSWARKGDHDRAESALIAEYGRRSIFGQSRVSPFRLEAMELAS